METIVPVISLVIVVVLFALWHSKTNKMIDLLTKQLNNQRAILKHLTKEENVN